jgi:hypothetical protein
LSFDPFGRSADLAGLAASGYELEVTAAGHLLVRQVPYLTSERAVARGSIVVKLQLDGDITVNPVEDHTIRFVGSVPCVVSGEPLRAVINSTEAELEPGLVVNHQLSSKPDQPYRDYFEQITAYIALIGAEARAVDPTVDARTFAPCVVDNAEWPFEYVDTASGRAGIGAISSRLRDQRVAIIGVGGTGSYILDLVSKCPVAEIHLFDGDHFSSHNAFRAPGAPSLTELRQGQYKVDHLRTIYSCMKRGIVTHAYDATAENADELCEMSFVFLAMEGGDTKRELVAALEARNICFVDCALGVVRSADRSVLLASIEINASTPADRASLHNNVDFGGVNVDDPYDENIQAADLNALNAVLAVLWWKKHFGVYYGREPYVHQRLNIPYNRLMTE